VQVREGLYYNPYFPGGAIAMPKMLADGGTEYDDGTVATEAQQAKVRISLWCYIHGSNNPKDGDPLDARAVTLSLTASFE
jgi:cytochrome c1